MKIDGLNQGKWVLKQRPGSLRQQMVIGGFAGYLDGALGAIESRQQQAHLEQIQRSAERMQKGTPVVRTTSPEQQRLRLRQAARELEAIFIEQMLAAMRRTIPRGEGILQQSREEELFQGMLEEEWANLMARAGDFGLADVLYEQLAAGLPDAVSDDDASAKTSEESSSEEISKGPFREE